MKIEKKLVYLPIKEGVLSVSHWDKDNHIQDVESCFGYFFTKEELNEYTQSLIKQVLETAAEKTEKEWCSDGYSTGMWKEVVDKQSITNTFEEIFKKFEL